MSEYRDKIHSALKDMTPANRMDAYLETVKQPPMNSHDISNLQIYKETFQTEYPDEFAKAEKAAKAAKAAAAKAELEALEREALKLHDEPSFSFENDVELDNIVKELLKRGGKTRRNRRGRRGRGRGRRSLKHKHSKRR